MVPRKLFIISLNRQFSGGMHIIFKNRNSKGAETGKSTSYRKGLGQTRICPFTTNSFPPSKKPLGLHIRQGKVAEAPAGGLPDTGRWTPTHSALSIQAHPSPVQQHPLLLFTEVNEWKGTKPTVHLAQGLCSSEHSFYYCYIVWSMSTGDKEERWLRN